MLKHLFLLSVCWFYGFTAGVQAQEAQWIEGQDYEVLSPQIVGSLEAQEGAEVVDFFSYGCPWCFRLEPTLSRLQKGHPGLVFKKVPVIFEPGWDVLAKAYYTAESLGVLDKLHPILFEKVQKAQLQFKDVSQVRDVFVQAGVKAEDFDAYFHSFAVASQVQKGKHLFESYQLYATPVVIVNRRYKADLQNAKGSPERFAQIIDFLLALKG